MIVITQFIKTAIVSAFVLFIVYHLVTRHMNALARWAQSANLNEAVVLAKNIKKKDEIDLVVDSINNMRRLVVHSIQERDEAMDKLEELNHNLEDKVEERTQELSATRKQLVETEKLAQLGSLVAGVAHELNTPLGVCVTACSLLETGVRGARSKGQWWFDQTTV